MYRLCLFLLAWVPIASAQTLTGSILGSVQDPSGLPVARAVVKAVQVGTGATQEATTDERGDFVLRGLTPSQYTLTVSSEGFKTLERRGIVLPTAERLSVGVLTLEIGALTERVTVTAEGTTVQTASAERSGLVTSSQVDNLLIRGRTITSLLALLPGVVDLKEPDSIDRNWTIHVQGNRSSANTASLDGLSLDNVGSMGGQLINLSQDAISEVKVLLSNYQAEYGLMGGANVILVSKSGTRDFHGLASYFKRHEQFNANNFFNNRLNRPKPRSRYNTWNYNVGGPVYIPGRFNRNREKLFFFWSQEFWPTRKPLGIRQVTVPTDLERGGDFRESLDLNNKQIVIADPLSQGQPFSGNRVPPSRIDPNGQALMKVFPLPNFLDRSVSGGRYNYVYDPDLELPKRLNLLRLEYNFDPKNRLSATSAGQSESYEGTVGVPTAGATNWPQMRKSYDVGTRTYQLRYQHLFSPTLINELSVGHLRLTGQDTYTSEELRRSQRDVVGFKTGQFYPQNNPLKVIPNVFFDVPSAANLAFEGRFPFLTRQYRFDLTNNVSKVAGTHTLKAGIFINRVWTSPTRSTNFNGALNFGRHAQNPLDTGYSYANAILGNFMTYTEASFRGQAHVRSRNIEWFAQDTWKAARRLTLDYGVRFCLIPPMYERDNLVTAFSPAAYEISRQVRLIEPRLVEGKRVGVHPLTGQAFPAPLIGAIAPGSGDAANGMVRGGERGYPRGLMDDRGVHYAPRAGFAWDLFGTGRTALRGGFGVFYNRQVYDTLLTGGYTAQRPVVENPMVYFGTLAALLSSSGLDFPASGLGLDRAGHVPTIMNFSLSVQQNIGFGTVVDVGYVGSLGRHLMWQRDLNVIPLGANFRPDNADPTNPRVALPSPFLRPLPGYNDITFREHASSSNYHSLQVSANRRYARGIQFGASWTWSKAMDFNDSDAQTVSTLVPVRVWNYGLASFDRTHVFKLNWIWDVPKTPWRFAPARWVLNDWQVSGIASFVSGPPLGLGYSTTVAMDITGTPSQGARIVVVDNPVLPKGQRTFSRNFRTDVFRLPAVGTIGNAAKTLIRGPGINNWDLAVFKNFPIREPLRFQFRWEMYNAFNHTQFAGLDTTARFDPAGNQVNASFGEFTSALRSREMQLALRFYF